MSKRQQYYRNRHNRPFLNLEHLEERLVPTTFTFLEDTGANAAAIQSTVDSFRSSLGTLNANVAGSFGSGRREINWDGVPDAKAAPNALPADFFNTTSPRGAVFSTPGSGFEVSANAGVGPVRFDDINGNYSSQFATFSAQRLFTPVGSNVTDVTFFVPGSTTPASVTGFGAVFTDVENTFSTKIEFFSNNNVLLFSRTVLPGPVAQGSLSFLGAKADSGTPIFKVRITTGAGVLGTDDITQGGTDKVVMDDFIYGEPLVAAEGGSVSGIVFSDVNGDGVKQASEPVLSGITVFEDSNANGIFDGAEKHTQTAANGTWSLTFVADGVRRIRHEKPFGSTQTTANTNVNIFGGSTDTLDFGDQLNTPVSNVTVNAPNTVNENGQVTISGTFDDADSQLHTVTIDFGDGTTPGVINLGAGVTSYSTTHVYLDDDPSGTSSDVKLINVTVSDGIGSDSATRNITVNNVAPSNANVTATPTVVGGTSTITVTFTDPGTLDPHLIDLDFGDGSPIQSFGVAPGQSIFNKNHVYAVQGTFTITATVHDDDLGTAPVAQTTLVVNPPDTTPPTIASGSISKISINKNSVGTDLVITINFNEALNTSVIPLLAFSPDVTSTLTLVSSQWINSDTHVFTYGITDANVEQTTFATVSLAQDIAGNVMLPDTLGVGITIDTIAPTVTDIDDGDSDNLVTVGATLTYTITFSEWMNGSSASAGDFDNAGSAAITIGTIAQTSNTTLTVQVTPTSAGTLQLRIPSGATIIDIRGNGLVPPVLDGDVLTVGSPLPIVTPAGSQTGSEGNSKLFDLGFFTDFNNSGNYTVTVNWGDGTSDTVINQAATGTIAAQNHTYAQDGNFPVTVTVSDVDGSSTPVSFQANISNVLPVAVDAPDQNAVATIAKSFALGSFTDPGDDAPWHITVNWGDGSPNGSFMVNTPGTLPPVVHTFASAGDFNVVVTVQDDDGSTTSDYLVHVIPPVAHLTGNIFRDFNNNGQVNAADVGLAGVIIFADRNGNGLLDGNEPSTITDIHGDYQLDVGFEGAVSVRQIIPNGFKQTTANPADVTVQFGDTVGVQSIGDNRLITSTIAVGGKLKAAPFVQVRNADGTLRLSFTPYPAATSLKEVRLATGDVNDDGIEDIFVIPGPGGSSLLKIFDGANGTLLRSFQAFTPSFSAGSSIAAGDVNGDGIADVIVGTDKGSGPLVRVFDGSNAQLIRSFTPVNATSKTGVRVAAGDVNGDGAVDVITAPATSTKRVKFNIRALDVLSGATLLNFQVNPVNHDTANLNLSAGDLDGDGRAEIMLATNRLHQTDLQTFKNGVLRQVGFPFAANFRTDGISVAVKDVTGDGIADLVFAGSQGLPPRLRIVNGATGQTILNALLLGDKDRNGLVVG